MYNNATITSRGWWGVEYIIRSIFLQIINVSKYAQVCTALCKDPDVPNAVIYTKVNPSLSWCSEKLKICDKTSYLSYYIFHTN